MAKAGKAETETEAKEKAVAKAKEKAVAKAKEKAAAKTKEKAVAETVAKPKEKPKEKPVAKTSDSSSEEDELDAAAFAAAVAGRRDDPASAASSSRARGGTRTFRVASFLLDALPRTERVPSRPSLGRSPPVDPERSRIVRGDGHVPRHRHTRRAKTRSRDRGSRRTRARSEKLSRRKPARYTRVYIPDGDAHINTPDIPGRPYTSLHHLVHIRDAGRVPPAPATNAGKYTPTGSIDSIPTPAEEK